MHICLLNRYCRQGASSRLRSLQYLPFLAQRGFKIDALPLYDEDYIKTLYFQRRRDPGNVLNCYLRRAVSLTALGRYDLIWLEQEIFPWLPSVTEKLIHRSGIPYVVDYDDAIFHRYDQHPSSLVRRLLGRKIDAIMKYSALVIAGNRYLADHARRAGAPNVEIIPTVIDLNRYIQTNAPKPFPFTIGWIGSPETFDYFRPLAPLLIELQKRHPIRILVIGAEDDAMTGLPFDFQPWTEDSEVEQLRTMDVGIMPLPDSPWTKGKCGYKLIQYMACGVPVVASKVGANIDIVENGKSGFLVSSRQEWMEAIEYMVDNPDECRLMGVLAREAVERNYHLGITAPRLAECLLRIGTRMKI